jgi:hypothetical protein
MNFKRLLSLLVFITVHFAGFSQEIKKSKFILNNGDVISGKIVEVKPGDYIKIEILASNVITIPYNDIKLIYIDETTEVSSKPIDYSKPSEPKEKNPLSDFYFESNNELLLNIGVGKVYGLKGLDLIGSPTILNQDVAGGFYSANGVGYKKQFFAGIGLGYIGHSEDYYSIPYMLDLRYRIFKDKKFSPIVKFSVGAEYLKGGLGTFSFVDGVGLNIKFKDKLSANFIFTHTFVRYMPNLSLENGPAEDITGNSYFNYIGARLGVSFKI